MAKRYRRHARGPQIRPLTPEDKRRKSSITAQEIEKAIYMDFEGFENKPPTLIGSFCEGEFSQIVFNSALRLAANAKEISVHQSDVESYPRVPSIATARRHPHPALLG